MYSFSVPLDILDYMTFHETVWISVVALPSLLTLTVWHPQQGKHFLLNIDACTFYIILVGRSCFAPIQAASSRTELI